MNNNIFAVKNILLLFLILTLALNNGCQSKKIETKKIKLRLNVWAGGKELQVWRETVNSFIDKNTGIEIELDAAPYGGYEAKILTQIAGGTPPDIIMGQEHVFFRFQEKGVLLNLMPFIKKDKGFNLDGFFPDVIEPFVLSDKIYSIPFGLDMYNCLFYNKDLFDKLGLPYPEDDWTWDEFLETAKALTLANEDGTIKRYGFVTWHWSNFVFSNGGNLVDDIKNPTRITIDEPESIEAIQFFTDLIHKYKVMPPVYSLSESGREMFMAGKVGMFSGSIGHIGLFKDIKSFDWDMTRLPKGPRAGHSAGLMGYIGYGISKYTKYPEESWRLLKSLTDEEPQWKMASCCGTMPTIKSVAERYVRISDKPDNKGFLVEEVKYGVFSPFVLSWSEIFDNILHPEFYLVIDRGTETIDMAIKKVLPAANKVLNERSKE